MFSTDIKLDDAASRVEIQAQQAQVSGSLEVSGALSAAAGLTVTGDISADGSDVSLRGELVVGNGLRVYQGGQLGQPSACCMDISPRDGKIRMFKGDLLINEGDLLMCEGDLLLRQGNLTVTRGRLTLEKGSLVVKQGGITLEEDADIIIMAHNGEDLIAHSLRALLNLS